MGSSNTLSFARAIAAGLIAGLVAGGIAALFSLVATGLLGAQRFDQLTPGVVFMVAVGVCLVAGGLYHRLQARVRRPSLVFAGVAAACTVVASAVVIFAMPRQFGVVAHAVHLIVAITAATMIPRLVQHSARRRPRPA